VIFLSHLKGLSASLTLSIVVLSACAPIPPQNGSGLPPAAPVAKAPPAPAPTPTAPTPRVPGVQHIPVGGTAGYHTEVVVTPPSQVCDFDAFAEGFQYGYASTWNRLAMEAARGDPAKNPASATIPTFDPTSIRLQEERYKIQWNGNERVNACESDGYLIGRIVGTHQAAVDQKVGVGQ
jgi:hypothetical protein